MPASLVGGVEFTPRRVASGPSARLGSPGIPVGRHRSPWGVCQVFRRLTRRPAARFSARSRDGSPRTPVGGRRPGVIVRTTEDAPRARDALPSDARTGSTSVPLGWRLGCAQQRPRAGRTHLDRSSTTTTSEPARYGTSPTRCRQRLVSACASPTASFKVLSLEHRDPPPAAGTSEAALSGEILPGSASSAPGSAEGRDPFSGSTSTCRARRTRRERCHRIRCGSERRRGRRQLGQRR